MHKTIGKCIYCGSDNKLTDEHVIPYGLLVKGHEQMILKKASCSVCQDITKKFEEDVQRRLMRLTRAFLDLKSRHKSHPKSFELELDEKKINIPTSRIGVWLPLPLFEPPHAGRIDVEGINIIGAVFIKHGGEDHIALRESYGAKSIGMHFKLNPTTFVKFLAKIAYGAAVYRYGLEGIAETFILPTILGTEKNLGKWVGGSKKEFKGEPYISLRLGFVNRDYIVCHISLFECWNGPTYVVCVGRVKKN